MARGRFWEREEVDFIIANFKKMAGEELAIKTNRSVDAIRVKLFKLRSEKLINFKPRERKYKKDLKCVLVADYVKLIKESLENSVCLNLVINNIIENVKVLNNYNAYFTVQRANYRESYQYTDLLLGDIKIIS